MHHLLFGDRAATDALLGAVREHSQSFSSSLAERPTGVNRPHVPSITGLPEEGVGGQEALLAAISAFDGIVAATSSPRYLGYVTGGVTPAALAGDWLTSLYDQNPQGLKAFGDASARIEIEAVTLLRQLLGLPDDFNGGFVTGATMSAFTCLGVARQWMGRRQGYDVAEEGLRQPIHVLTATPHSSALKSLAMLGLGRSNIISVATLPGREAMDIADLERKAAALSGAPFILIASGGTVNTVDFDDLEAVLELRKKHDFWLHVDAAFGGFAVLARPQVRGTFLKRWEEADSITVDNHKWLNVPYDSGTWFIRKEHQLLQQQTFSNGNAAYLNTTATDFTYLNLGPENSRRLRALPVWCTLKAYGRAGYADIVNRSVDTAFALGEALTNAPEFELLAPVRLNVVAFTVLGLSPEAIDLAVQQLSDDGKYFMTPTTLDGRRGIRAAFVNWQHEVAQVPDIMAALRAALQKQSSPTL